MPREGLFYAIRVPTGWTLIVGRIEDPNSLGDFDWFKEVVAGIVAKKWAGILKRNETDMRGEIEHLYRAFPRGMASTKDGEMTLTWGEKDNLPMKAAVEREFAAEGLFAWCFDPLFTPRKSEKDEMKKHLGIRDDWEAL